MAKKREPASPSVLVERKKTVLGFRFENGVFVAQNERGIFKPHGLVIWGPIESANVRLTTIDLREQVLQSADGIPARFFALGLSFQHIAQLLEQGVEPPSWVDWDRLERGSKVRVLLTDEQGQVLGPAQKITLAMWGVNELSVSDDEQPAAPAPAPSSANGSAK